MIKTRNRTLELLMNGIVIGQLEKATKGGRTFTYLDGYRKDSLVIPK